MVKANPDWLCCVSPLVSFAPRLKKHFQVNNHRESSTVETLWMGAPDAKKSDDLSPSVEDQHITTPLDHTAFLAFQLADPPQIFLVLKTCNLLSLHNFMMGHRSILYTEFVIFKKSLITGSFIETYAGENTFSWHNGLISRLPTGWRRVLAT